MKGPTETGSNRTGIETSGKNKDEVLAGATFTKPAPLGETETIPDVMLAYAMEQVPIGTVPPPSSLRGLAKTLIEGLRGRHATAFLDKLGERAVFERTGTRLYDTLIVKFDAFGSFEGGPTREELVAFRSQEASHYALLAECIVNLGADPTCETPSADVAFVASSGIGKVLSDPRTTLVQCLETMLIAELTDNDAWDSLIGMAKSFGMDELVERFGEAKVAEARHLSAFRAWIAAASAERVKGEESAA